MSERRGFEPKVEYDQAAKDLFPYYKFKLDPVFYGEYLRFLGMRPQTIASQRILVSGQPVGRKGDDPYTRYDSVTNTTTFLCGDMFNLTARGLMIEDVTRHPGIILSEPDLGLLNLASMVGMINSVARYEFEKTAVQAVLEDRFSLRYRNEIVGSMISTPVSIAALSVLYLLPIPHSLPESALFVLEELGTMLLTLSISYRIMPKVYESFIKWQASALSRKSSRYLRQHDAFLRKAINFSINFTPSVNTRHS